LNSLATTHIINRLRNAILPNEDFQRGGEEQLINVPPLGWTLHLRFNVSTPFPVEFKGAYAYKKKDSNCKG